MNASLAREQRALLECVLSPRFDSAPVFIAEHIHSAWTLGRRGLQTYRANGQALAARGLGAAYPVLAQLLGDESFTALARAFWHRHPPRRGDMAQWGGELPGFIASAAQLASEPYLADVARAEWALHRAADAADVAADPASWSRLASDDPSTFTLALAPGTALTDSAFPVASLLAAHTGGEITLAQAGARLAAGTAECALVWREGLRARVRAALPGEGALVAALLGGAALDVALSAAEGLDFSAWLALAASTGLLLAVASLEPRPPHPLAKTSP